MIKSIKPTRKKNLAQRLIDTSSAWEKFFDAKYANPLNCIAAMPPGNEKKTGTILRYYIAMHPDLKKKAQEWNFISFAYTLYNSDKAWRTFFITEFHSPEACIQAMHAEWKKKKTILTIIRYYLIFHKNIKDFRNWLNYAAARDIIEKSPAWKKFFESQFETPLECLKAIPRSNQLSIATIMTYYVAYRGGTELNLRLWINASNAMRLYKRSTTWKRFFDKKYNSAQECIAAIPQKSTLSISTVITYYFSLHPKMNTLQRRWVQESQAYILHNSDENWKTFFDREYDTPLACIQSIPEGNTISIATIITFYFYFHDHSIGKMRYWINTANAIILRESSFEWKKFFNQKFSHPEEMLQCIPKTHLSQATITSYYCILHPDIPSKTWHFYVNATLLRNSDEKWKDFFDRNYSNLGECIEAIPNNIDKSISTIINYYVDYHYDNQQLMNDWVIATNAILFFIKNPELLNLLKGKDNIVGKIIELSEGEKIPNKRSLRRYMLALRKCGITYAYIKKLAEKLTG